MPKTTSIVCDCCKQPAPPPPPPPPPPPCTQTHPTTLEIATREVMGLSGLLRKGGQGFMTHTAPCSWKGSTQGSSLWHSPWIIKIYIELEVQKLGSHTKLFNGHLCLQNLLLCWLTFCFDCRPTGKCLSIWLKISRLTSLCWLPSRTSMRWCWPFSDNRFGSWNH